MAISIYRGTTPILRCILPEELTDKSIAEVWITLKFFDRATLHRDQIDYFLSKGEFSLSGNVITLAMSQDDTLRLHPNDYRLDIRILLSDGSAVALKQKKTIHVIDVLKDGRIEIEGISQNRIIPVVLSDKNSTEFTAIFNEAQQTFNAELGTQIVVGSGDYNGLTNRPQINGVTLEGNLSFEDLGFYSIQPDMVKDIWDEI